MKRKGRPLLPAALPVPGSSAVAARPASRAADDEMDDEMGFGEVDAEGSGEPKTAQVADTEESDIADPTDTKDLVRQRAMRVTAEEEEPEALDELAEDALEATHEDAAVQPSAKLHAPPGTTRPQAKRGPAPAAAEEPKREGARPAGSEAAHGVARSIAAKALEVAAKVLAPARPAAKAPARPAPPKAKPAPPKKAAKPAPKPKKPIAKKPAARKPAKKAAVRKPAGKGKR